MTRYKLRARDDSLVDERAMMLDFQHTTKDSRIKNFLATAQAYEKPDPRINKH